MMSPSQPGVPFGEVRPPPLATSKGQAAGKTISSPASLARAPERDAGTPFPRRVGRAGSSSTDADLNLQYNAVLSALSRQPPRAIAADKVKSGDTAKGGGPALPRKTRRGIPLVQWVWPSNTSTSAISRAESNAEGEAAVAGAVGERFSEENPMRQQQRRKELKPNGRKSRRPSAVVTGKVCEPVRPKRLDLSANRGERNDERRITNVVVVEACIIM